MKSLVIAAAVFLLLAMTAPLNDAARRKIDERLNFQSTQVEDNARQLHSATQALNAAVDGGDLGNEARAEIRRDSGVYVVMLVLLAAGVLGLVFVFLAVIAMLMMGNEWNAYRQALTRRSDLRRERRDLDMRRQQSAQPPSPYGFPSPATRRVSPHDTMVSRSRQNRRL